LDAVVDGVVQEEARPADELLEREAELRQLGRVLDAVADGEGSVGVAAGIAGVGKTKLLEAAIEAAGPVGVRPLVARASRLEGDFALGVVRQLLEPVVLGADEEEREALFAGAARHAAAALDLDPEAALDRELHTTLHGLYWLIVNLSAAGPLLLAVDDVQWADEQSVRWLAYLVRRLVRLPVALMLTARTDGAGRVELPEDATPALAQAIDEILGRERALRLEPAPLSASAVAELVERGLGQAGDERFVEACRAHTGGNAFFLSELIAELAAEDVEPTGANVAVVERIVPERVGETTRRHLARVSADARTLADALAVLGDGVELGVVAELAGLDLDRAAAAAGELAEAQVLADSRELRFRHPLLRAAVEAEIPGPEVGQRQARAARLLADRGAPAPRVASHLVLSPPGSGDDWTVEQLRAAARSARAQGAGDRAIALLERALAEPPGEAQRALVLRELGTTELSALQPGASPHLNEALELTSDPAERAETAIALGLANYYGARHAEAADVLIAMIDEVGDNPELRESRLIMEAVLALAGRYDLATEERVRGRILELADEIGDETPGERLVQAVAASQHPGPTAEDLVRSSQLEERSFGTVRWPEPVEGIGTIAMYLHAGRPDLAEQLVERQYARALEEGSPLRHAMAVGGRGLVALDVGDLHAAEENLEAGIEAVTELGVEELVYNSACFLVLALAGRGKLERAQELLVENHQDGEMPERMFFNPMLFCRGMFRLEQRRFDLAEADFRELGRRHELWGMTRPSPPWRSAIGLTLIARGEREEARRIALEELEMVRVWNTPKAIAFTTRVLGLAAEGDESVELLAEAVDLLEGTPWRLDRARARIELGAALRREGRRRDGREALALGMDEANACGADGLAELAADELRASGARPRRRAISGIDALTPSERRVAEMAADGRTNREIAQELFVTMATVETHLTRVYRKLDVAGRGDLAGALSAAA
jgi:DNA-binding CsgD family transcriptional regulator/tetratricopeptide (TPR) repeat protein